MSCLGLEVRDIIIVILIILIACLFYKTRKIQSNTGKIEGFAVTNEIRAAIKEEYKADIDAIRNLSSIATKITTENDKLVLPAGLTNIKGYTYMDGGLGVAGEVTFYNNVKFPFRNNSILEMYPTYMILMWLHTTAPKGWAMCDGGTYKLNADGIAVPGTPNVDIGTPDLRGRFPICAGQGTDYGLTNKPLWSRGGNETHTLTVAEMPSHIHNIRTGYGTGGTDFNRVDTYANLTDHGEKEHLIKPTGGDQPHNNMPPYYAINFIMKI
jgi:microcystin-dependent protein